ncbi:hypothetical protein BU24DRAFT_423865 [Aaosphaeria arxii CBS 175.79]|uniref:Methyltransferase domain-containing protein n=1 Tax=Aaosphaeria arxii CBS 175.79 TaxID=1450172 RepID=A0A6A5XPW0_9PLEO|nr:uncharacterized protein BU24DRAFT_423865 [Aaosphaeria arxii CBS 175.79]KAF2014946.1 hypothetical protein BU24DRAFT_423865 [Aaosphaeria arxii CBS 175.79]
MAETTPKPVNIYWSHDLQNVEKLPWYQKELQEINPEARELFEKYSQIPSEEVVSHITQFRDEGFKVFPYPCLGKWGFLNFNIRRSPQYDEILRRVKNGDKLLDIGCCVGQDIRKLVYDGAPSENLVGSDLKKEFMDIGYDLFRDGTTLKATFIAADIFDPESDLKTIDGSMDIVYASHFFHLFNWDEQVDAAKRMVALLKPKAGSLVVGRHTGHTVAEETTPRFKLDKPKFRHNAESFARLWKQVEEETGTNFKIDSFYDDEAYTDKNANFMPEGTRTIGFSIERL